MQIVERNGNQYRLPNRQNGFQRDMYIHLIDWKWKHITTEQGYYRNNPYDAILPKIYGNTLPIIYSTIVSRLRTHRQRYPFRIHKFFNHMGSSQAANANLFLPIIINPQANSVFQRLRPNFERLALCELDRGFRIEYWDDPHNSLNDHSKVAGTDSDIAIAYYNKNDELCLWLIEHKLTEKEFTTCGGFKSKGNSKRHYCKNNINVILENKDICYYHREKKFNYWDIMEGHRSLFPNYKDYAECPFKGGMNQLWRNLLMAIAIENDERIPFKHVYFSVAKHPDNTYLDDTITRFKKLINDNPIFSVFTSRDVLAAAKSAKNPDLDQWIAWYQDLYHI